MTEESILDVLGLQRFSEKGIRAEIDHTGRKIIAGSPISMHLAQFLGSERRRDFGSDFSCACHSMFSDNSRFGHLGG